MTRPWRVIRQTGHGNGVEVCAHRWERTAHWHARWYERREPVGVWFGVRKAVD